MKTAKFVAKTIHTGQNYEFKASFEFKVHLKLKVTLSSKIISTSTTWDIEKVILKIHMLFPCSYNNTLYNPYFCTNLRINKTINDNLVVTILLQPLIMAKEDGNELISSTNWNISLFCVQAITMLYTNNYRYKNIDKGFSTLPYHNTFTFCCCTNSCSNR